MPNIKVNQTFNRFTPKAKGRNISIPNDENIDSLKNTISQILEELRKKASVDDVKRMFDENQFKLNRAFKDVERGSVAGANTTINTINNSGGGSSSSGKTIVQVSKSLSAGVASAEVFAAPSRLLGLPIAYSVVDGMGSTETLTPSSLNTAGFSITALQDATVIYSYQYI